MDMPTVPEEAEPRIVQTDQDAHDGLSKCRRCGATDIGLNIASGKLRCGFCRFEWSTEPALAESGLDGPISELDGIVMGSGSADITPSTDVVMTFKCQACGAEVVIDTNHSMQARCHWCRNTLSTNEQVPNGAVPDMVLPFSISKDDAVKRISKFVRQRKHFVHRQFRNQFKPENVMGVYLPYMIVDINAHARMSGHGEHTARKYTVKRGDKRQTRYDADVYRIQRSFDVYIDDLTVESSSDRLDQRAFVNTNNVINAVMPFDVQNSVCYDSNYLAGYASEKRDSDVEDLHPLVHAQAKDIARHSVNDTLAYYDRGVRWDDEKLTVAGQRWVSAYLPLWLYSYQETKKNNSTLLHYVAVNGRTGETMGSVPINQGKLIRASAVVQAAGVVLYTVIKVVGG